MSNIPPTGPSGEEPQQPPVTRPPGQPPVPSNPFAEQPTTGQGSPYASPNAPGEPYYGNPNHANQGDATGGVIPYKNPCALIGYYLAILGLFPCIGLLFSIPAFVLGIMGLRARARNPVVKGSVHAWIGIVLGGLCTLAWATGWVVLIVGWANEW